MVTLQGGQLSSRAPQLPAEHVGQPTLNAPFGPLERALVNSTAQRVSSGGNRQTLYPSR